MGSFEGNLNQLHEADLKMLLMWWALSEPVNKLAKACLENPRRILISSEDRKAKTQGVLEGEINASESVYLQLVTGDPTLFSISKQSPTWISGANRILVKMLFEAACLLRDMIKHVRSSELHGLVWAHLNRLERALKIESVQEILTSSNIRASISTYDRREAVKVRSFLYKLSWDCALTYQNICTLDSKEIRRLLNQELLAIIDDWFKFEMACALGVAEAFSVVLNKPYKLDIQFSSQNPFAVIDDYEIWLQRSIIRRPESELDYGELKPTELGSFLGVNQGMERADITIERRGKVLALAECKWFTNRDYASRAILDACHQVVRYARNIAWHQNESVESILSRSFLALGINKEEYAFNDQDPIACFDLASLENGSLTDWASSLVDS